MSRVACDVTFFVVVFFGPSSPPKKYQSYDPHRSRDSVSPVCGIFYSSCSWFPLFWHNSSNYSFMVIRRNKSTYFCLSKFLKIKPCSKLKITFISSSFLTKVEYYGNRVPISHNWGDCHPVHRPMKPAILKRMSHGLKKIV